jgi:8-oxo-dGTP pyrophosphatase MutT (NUDIX family)
MTEPRSLQQALPHFTVMAVPYDPVTRMVAMMWRGDRVRSAKNCLSTPAGLLEHGEPFEEGLLRELREEMAIEPDNCFRVEFQTIYRNDNGDGLDWVIGVWSVAVRDLQLVARNVEPDKHDYLVFMHLDDLASPNPMLDGKPAMFASSLQPVLRTVAKRLIQTL